MVVFPQRKPQTPQSLTVVNIYVIIFWYVIPFDFVIKQQRFGGAWCFHFQRRTKMLVEQLNMSGNNEAQGASTF